MKMSYIFNLFDAIAFQPNRLKVRVLFQIFNLRETYSLSLVHSYAYLCSASRVSRSGEESRIISFLRISF